MEIEWKEVKEAAVAAYNYFKEAKVEAFTGYVRSIYTAFYRAPQRDPGWNQVLQEEKYQQWADEATKAAFDPRSRWDIKSLQCHRTSADNLRKDNVFVQQKTGLTARDKIISIYHKVREAEVKSRIQITVQEDYAGMPLYDSMRGWVSSCSAVSKWKVMNPLLGSSGPDSAIVYLNRPLEDETVAAFVSVAVKELGHMIEPLSSTPLGLKKVAPGMYGADIPPETIQRNKLKMSGDLNSAGDIMASVICKAAWHAADKFNTDPGKAAKFGSEENYLRAILEKVLQEDMGWSLV